MAVSTVFILTLVFSQSFSSWEGHFDRADGAFNSIEMAWKSASGEDRNNIREVIPESYYLPDFLTSSNMLCSVSGGEGRVSNRSASLHSRFIENLCNGSLILGQ